MSNVQSITISKAFDCGDHNTLLDKFESFSLEINELILILSPMAFEAMAQLISKSKVPNCRNIKSIVQTNRIEVWSPPGVYPQSCSFPALSQRYRIIASA